jgi:hypothetical protein
MTAHPAKWPNYHEGDFVIRNYVFRSGETLPQLNLQPSGGNMQRWQFLVIRDPKVKETVIFLASFVSLSRFHSELPGKL